MTPQQKTDFAPILEAFPDSTFEDGLPMIKMALIDAEADPVQVSIDSGGIVSFDTDDYSYLMLGPEELIDLAAKAQFACSLHTLWDETPSGRAFYADHSA